MNKLILESNRKLNILSCTKVKLDIQQLQLQQQRKSLETKQIRPKINKHWRKSNQILTTLLCQNYVMSNQFVIYINNKKIYDKYIFQKLSFSQEIYFIIYLYQIFDFFFSADFEYKSNYAIIWMKKLKLNHKAKTSSHMFINDSNFSFSFYSSTTHTHNSHTSYRYFMLQSLFLLQTFSSFLLFVHQIFDHIKFHQ